MSSAVALIPGLGRPTENTPAPTERAPAGFSIPTTDAAATQRPGLVQPVRTPITAEQASSLIGDALEHVTGEKPKPETVAILTAQWAHETGHGASMFNYNFAGIKGTGPSGLSVAQRTHEGWGSTERTITDNFRAYRTAEEGARDYVSLLKSRFPGALAAAQTGDPAATVHALKQAGYFTGDEAAYTRSVTQIARQVGPASLEFTNTGAGALPELPLDYAQNFSTRGASGAGFETSGTSPFVASADFSDHVLRAALRILASPTDEQNRSKVPT
jgi:hypothetical protein